MLLSIVSGTYNRFNNLKMMVESVRSSVGIGIPYEIVIVDGGSTDGTLVWCANQPDIVLIQQNKLMGAVIAFQAGFEAARGKYVIIGNDDIVYVDDSIQCALSFIEDNPTVGIGCFYQDRYGKAWHVEHMAVVEHGVQTHAPYGQVCIIPRWLGNLVGWWGTEYHTYAGDNDLSCKVLELGYQVLPVPCACIHDDVAQDTLRKINNPNNKDPHPDSMRYVQKWTRNGKLGPVIPTYTRLRIDRRMPRILYAPIYEKGNILQHKTKRGLRDALVEAGYIVSEVDYIANPMAIFDVASAIRPDIILTQFHDAGIYNLRLVKELKSENPNATFVNWNGDYFPEHFFNHEYMNMLKEYDLATFVTRDVDKKYIKAGIPWAYWQIGYEVSHAVPDKSTPRHDVVFLGNGHYDFRIALGRTLRSIPGVNVGLYGSWNKSFRPDGNNLYDYDTGKKLYMNAKIAISDGRPNTRFTSNRIFQAMISGCFTLQQWFPEIYDMLEFDEGIHFVTYKKTEELPELINYWLAHDAERIEVAKAGYQRTRVMHSFDRRVIQLEKLLENHGVPVRK